MIPSFLLLQSPVPQTGREGRLPNVAVRQRLSSLPLARVRVLTVVFIRSKAVETSVGYNDLEMIRRWATALSRSARLKDRTDPGRAPKRPFEEGLVRFTLKSGRRVEFPLFTENEVIPYWGREVGALYGRAMKTLERTMESTPPR